MIVVISDTVILLTSSPSIAMIRSPGVTLSTRGLDVLTPETTVPFESALFAKIIPNFPGGAVTVTLILFERDDALERGDMYGLRPVRLRLEEVLMLLGPVFAVTATTGKSSRFSWCEPTIASCISNRRRSFATVRLS